MGISLLFQSVRQERCRRDQVRNDTGTGIAVGVSRIGDLLISEEDPEKEL